MKTIAEITPTHIVYFTGHGRTIDWFWNYSRVLKMNGIRITLLGLHQHLSFKKQKKIKVKKVKYPKGLKGLKLNYVFIDEFIKNA